LPKSENNNDWLGGLLALGAGALGTALFMLFNNNKNPPNVGPFMNNNNDLPPPPPPKKEGGCGCSNL